MLVIYLGPMGSLSRKKAYHRGDETVDVSISVFWYQTIFNRIWYYPVRLLLSIDPLHQSLTVPLGLFNLTSTICGHGSDLDALKWLLIRLYRTAFFVPAFRGLAYLDTFAKEDRFASECPYGLRSWPEGLLSSEMSL